MDFTTKERTMATPPVSPIVAQAMLCANSFRPIYLCGWTLTLEADPGLQAAPVFKSPGSNYYDFCASGYEGDPITEECHWVNR